MSSTKYKSNSSVEKHMLADQKVRGSILSQAEHSFCGPAQIYTGFHRDMTRENTSSNHERYTRNGANRISSITRV